MEASSLASASYDPEAALKGVGPHTFERVVMRVLVPHDVSQPGYRVFEGRGPPTISVSDYIMRIAFYVPQSSPSMWVTALLYIDRLLKRNAGLILARNNVHRLIITSVMAALKYNEDKTYANEFFARVAGVNLVELNTLELAFLRLLDFELYVTPATFVHAVNTLCRLSDAAPVNLPSPKAPSVQAAQQQRASPRPHAAMATTSSHTITESQSDQMTIVTAH